MPANTGKGYTYSLGTDPVATIDTSMQALAEKVDESPGIRPMSTAQRDALGASEKWAGRVIWNLTSDRLERYNAVSQSWLPVTNSSLSFRDTHSFTLQGDIRVDNAARDFAVNGFAVELLAGQSMIVRGVRHWLEVGGPVEFAIDRRTAAGATTRLGTFPTTTTYTRSTTGLPATLADGDRLFLVVLSAAAGSKHLTASLAYDITV